MNNDTIYYWRIDEVNAGDTTTGTVWNFTTIVAAPGQASSPSPANAATDVAVDADLSWTAGSGATSHDVYFGASSPGTFQGNQAGTTFDTGTMAEDTTYYWRIDEVNAGGTTTGAVWSFTTLATPVVISNLDPSAYNVVYDALAVGQLLYVDRTMTYDSVPAAYQGETFIQTENDDKDGAPNNSITFDINLDCTVYVAMDDRVPRPTWLTSSFTDTGDDLSDNSPDNVTLSLFRKDFPAGTVNLYENGLNPPSYSMYTVVVIPAASSAPEPAYNPNPADSATDVGVETDLSWSAGAGATSHDVYFGQTSPGTFQGNQGSVTFDPGTMNEYTTYYWRIDEINAYGTNTGTVWSFTTDSGTASDMYSDTWVAVDALGRALPDNSICGDPRSGVTTGIFYFLWLGEHSSEGPYDNTDLLAANPSNPAWGPEGVHHHWGESELGYYLSDDEYVMRKHAHMLADAGVDVIFFDVTNGWTYENNYEALCSVFTDIRADGGTTPQIAFLANAYADNVVENIYNNLYSQNRWPELWFYWKGKPLILAPLNGMEILGRTITYSSEIQNFFNMRYSWAWNAGYDLWTWIDYYPQDYGWHESSSIPEELSVAMGHWPHENIGRSYSNGSQPAHDIYGLTGTEDQGINFTEQLSRLDTIDPELLFITGWNEWVAGRHVFTGSGDPVTHFIGDPLQPGDSWFVDNYNQEYSRDAEPMKDGHTDNYYYQMIDGIRRYKGVRELPTPSAPTTISIDGSFSDWDSVGPKYRDWKNDTTHRDHDGYGSAGPYTNTTGRNDFITAKVARDNTYIYFYIKTAENITSYTDNNWMMLFINADQNYADGWEGYDYVVNMAVNSTTSTTLKGTSGGWNWTDVDTNVAYQVSGNQMEIRVARSDIDQGSGGDPIAFDFHLADNIQNNDDIIEFAVSGDSAPGRRFNYRYEGAGVATPGQASDPSPADSATGVSVDADLSWTAGSGATSHDVYFGETSPGSYQGNQAGTTFDPGTMTENATYYWRIDGVNANGTTTGTVWSFTTETSGSASFVLWQLPSQTDLQMNSYVIKTINDEIIVIDGGYAEDADYLKGFLSTLGNEVDIWFISHQHKDHIGALTTILGNPEGLVINNIYGSMQSEAWIQTNEPAALQTTVDFNAALSAAGKTVTELTLGQLIQLDNISIKIIGVKNPEITTQALNNSSVAMKVWDCQNSVLFLGDLAPDGGQKILDGPYLADLDSDYVQMAHHGQNGVTEAFYTVVAPTYCLWPTPLWLWNNDDGGGYDSGPWLTLIVREWMVNLGVQENYCMFDGLISINMICSASPGQASSPTPADSATDVAVNTDLSWTAGSDATSHDVYFGQDSTPDAGEFQGNQAGTTYDTGTMAEGTTYYWRIDEVNGAGTTTGVVWSFATEVSGSPPAAATNPSPANSATGVAITVDPSWTAGSGATSHDVYFGVDSTPDSTEFQGNQGGTIFYPGALDNDTTYYWRIDEVNAYGTTTGTVWSFTTVAAGPSTLYPNNDCTVRGTTNYNASDPFGLFVKNATDVSYIEFTTGGATATSAILQIHNDDPDLTANWDIVVKGAQYSFNEATFTGTDTSGWTTVGTIQDVMAVDFYTLDITTFYNNNLNQTITLYLTRNTQPSGSGPIFEDREGTKTGNGTTYGPQIDVSTGAAPPGQASSPSPSNGAGSVDVDADLSWTAGSGASTHDVYFGEDSTPDAGEFQGNQGGTTYDPGTMTEDVTYYWRIDEVNAYGTTTGTVWNFTTSSPPPPLTIFNTGVDGNGDALGDRVLDPHWTLTTSPDPTYNGPELYTVKSDEFPIPPWIANTSDSMWICPRQDATDVADGDYVYQLQFDLTGYDPGAVQITGQFSVDNSLTDVEINGTSTGVSDAGFGTWHAFGISSGFTTGINTLEFFVNNNGAGPAGLRVEMTLTTSTTGDWAITFPGATWESKSPASLGLDSAKLDQFAGNIGGQGIIVRQGYVVKTWGTTSNKADWASAAKPVTTTMLFFAIEEGLLTDVDELIEDHGWSLIAKDDPMTFYHLANMTSAYARGEVPGAAWAYNDYAIQLYVETLFDNVYGTTANTAATNANRLGALQFQDGSIYSSRNGYGIETSVRDFARIGWLWCNYGYWNGTQLLPRWYFDDYMQAHVSSGTSRSTSSGSDYLGIGTFGGGSDQTGDGPGVYGFNWWCNPNQSNWPDAPADTVQGNGHWGAEVITVIPSLSLVVAYKGGSTRDHSQGSSSSEMNQDLKLLTEACPEYPLGSIIVDPDESSRMVYQATFQNGDLKPVCFAGAGDPEDFFYVDTINNRNLLISRGSDSTYITAELADFGGGSPGTGSTLDNNLDTWETHITALEDAGVITLFVFFDDSHGLTSNWQELVDKCVAKFKHHKLLMWMVQPRS